MLGVMFGSNMDKPFRHVWVKYGQAVSQYAYLSVFLWACETSSVAAQVPFQFKVHI